MKEPVNTLFAKIRQQLESDLRARGILEDAADGDPDGMDDFDSYLGEIADSLLDQFDVSDDEAIDFVFDCSDELADAGTIPAIPEVDDPDAVSVWVGKAKTAGFAALVLQMANESAEDE